MDGSEETCAVNALSSAISVIVDIASGGDVAWWRETLRL